MLIGLVSDTHVPRRSKALPDWLLDGLQGVDLILHAGDLTDRSVLRALAAVAPVEAVAGNGDAPDLCAELGERKLLTLEGYRIGLVHGHGVKGNTLSRAMAAFADQHLNVIVFGHSHIPYQQWHEGTLLVNPGSPTDKRRQPQYSFGLLKLDTQGIQVEFRFKS
jgi:putative phosphoesterase